jgi:putative transposase
LNDRNGSLFSQNFKRKEVETMDYLRGVVIYIHRNPIKHGYIESIAGWKQSSYLQILHGRKEKINLVGEEVLSWFGGKESYRDFHALDLSVDME